MENPENISFIMAFVAGVLIFLSPCILPLIPAYLSYLTGVSFKEISDGSTKERKKEIKLLTVLHSLSFILGFSVIFVLLGASVTFIGRFLIGYKFVLEKIAGVLIICFAFIIMGVIKIPFLEKEKKFSYKKKKVSFFGSFIVGATFAAAWTPCVGPILGSILVYASSTANVKMGVGLLVAFSIGVGVPFFLSALIVNSILSYFGKIQKVLRWVTVVGGIVLLIFGILTLIGRIR